MLRHAHGIRVEEEQLVCFVWLDDGKVGSFIYYFFFLSFPAQAMALASGMYASQCSMICTIKNRHKQKEKPH